MENVAIRIFDEMDIRTLVRHPDNEARAFAAQRICRHVRQAEFSDSERKLAHDLLKYMAQDAAEMVRRALAVTLKNYPDLPRNIALKLAADVDSIAVPVLSFSPVFTDDDLIEILQSKAAAKACAVARRPSVSGTIVDGIIRYGDSQSVAAVAANDGAEISVTAAADMLESYRNDDLISQAIIARKDLPPTVIERLITQVSEDVAVALSQKYDLPIDIAIEIAENTRERATVDLIDQSWDRKDLKLLCVRLSADRRLTPGLILRAAGRGHMRFVEHALAMRGGISHAKAALMVHDNGPFGLKTLCRRAQMPDSETEILRAAVTIYRDLELSGMAYDHDYFQEIMIMRILTLPVSMSEADQNYFLEKLDGLSADIDAFETA